jgi:type VI secretion system protein VasI
MGVAMIVRFSLTASMAVLLFSDPVNASVKCAAVSDDAQRLECYDLEYRKSVKVVPQTSEWIVNRDISKFDDNENVLLKLTSLNTQDLLFEGAVSASIYIECHEGVTDLRVHFGGSFMMSFGEGGRVAYRIDERKSTAKDFWQSSDQKELGLWGGRASIPFIADLFGASNLILRATPVGSSSVTYEFNITGLEAAIAPLRSACNW